tara:strand:+ start:777 stop:971 length:195 start_codon:yes stop_codon:yes gene_type:complete
MSKYLNNLDKEFLTAVLSDAIQQLRVRALYETSPKNITMLVDNIAHIREIAKKLDLKYITPKLK